MLIEARNVTKAFGAFKAVDNASVSVEEGDILGLIGPNGAGKSTTFNLITGVLSLTRGEVNFRGQPVAGLPSREIARRGLSMADVQDVIGTAVGGKDAGLVFEGDRRFAIVVRLADSVRGDVEALKNLPVPLPVSQAAAARASTGVPAGPALAGGMSLIPMMKLRLATPEQLVDLARIKDLDYIREESGELHDFENLVVADASILPTSLGVNPMITIMACARRIASGLAQRLT